MKKVTIKSLPKNFDNPCPPGQVPDGKGGCTKDLRTAPIPTSNFYDYYVNYVDKFKAEGVDNPEEFAGKMVKTRRQCGSFEECWEELPPPPPPKAEIKPGYYIERSGEYGNPGVAHIYYADTTDPTNPHNRKYLGAVLTDEWLSGDNLDNFYRSGYQYREPIDYEGLKDGRRIWKEGTENWDTLEPYAILDQRAKEPAERGARERYKEKMQEISDMQVGDPETESRRQQYVKEKLEKLNNFINNSDNPRARGKDYSGPSFEKGGSLSKAQDGLPTKYIEGKITPEHAKEVLDDLYYTMNKDAIQKAEKEKLEQERLDVEKMWDEYTPEPPKIKKGKTLFGRPYQIVETDAGPDFYGQRKPGEEKTKVKTIYYKNGNIAKQIIENNEKGSSEITYHDKDGNVTALGSPGGGSYTTFSNGYFQRDNNTSYDTIKRAHDEIEQIGNKGKLDSFFTKLKLDVENLSKKGSQPGNSFNTVWPDWENDRFNYTRVKNPDVKKSKAKFEYGGIPKAQYGPPPKNALEFWNQAKAANAKKQSLLGELTNENNSKFAVSESTQPIAKMPQLPEEWKGKSIKEIEAQVKAQKEYDALPNAIKNPDVLTADKRSDLEKFARRAWTVASSPMQSIATVNRGGYIPSGYLGMHSAYESPNPMASVVDLALGTPAFIANAAVRQGEQLVNNPLEYGLTNTLGLFDPKMRDQAISNYLDLAAVVPAARAASPLLKNAGKSVVTRTGEVKNILFEPKLTTKQASLYNREKTENLLKSLFEGKQQGWDEQYWYKQAVKKQNKIKELPEYKNALEELQLADYELNEARLNNISYSMGKSNASKKDLIPYLERYNDAKAKITNIKGGAFDDARHQYNQRVLNKYGFPLDSRSIDDAASGYFGKVIPIVGDDSKLLKIGNTMPWETQADFDLLNSIGKSAQNPSLGFPVKSHIFSNIDAQVSKMHTPGIGVHILNKVSGEPLMKYMQGPDGLKNLKTILTPEAYNTAMQNLKFLQDNNVAVDWVNPNNFMINPKTGEIGIVDLSILPKEAFTSPYDFSGVRAISKFGVDYPALFDKAMGAFTGKYSKDASPSLQRYQRHIDQLMKNAPGYSFPGETKVSGPIWGNFDLTNPQWKIDPNNINPRGFKKGGRKKSEAGFKILTDTNGKYVFVNT